MPTATKYTYSIANDFPGGKANSDNLTTEIAASSIVTALDRIGITGDVIDIWFKDALSAADKTTLDNDTTGPAGGLIAAHDNSASIIPDQVSLVNSTINKRTHFTLYVGGVAVSHTKRTIKRGGDGRPYSNRA